VGEIGGKDGAFIASTCSARSAAPAALDRLTHHTHTLTICGSSYRQRQRRKEEPIPTTTLSAANEA